MIPPHQVQRSTALLSTLALAFLPAACGMSGDSASAVAGERPVESPCASSTTTPAEYESVLRRIGRLHAAQARPAGGIAANDGVAASSPGAQEDSPSLDAPDGAGQRTLEATSPYSNPRTIRVYWHVIQTSRSASPSSSWHTDPNEGYISGAALRSATADLTTYFTGAAPPPGMPAAMDTKFRFSFQSVDYSYNDSWYTMGGGSVAEDEAKRALRKGTTEDLNLYVCITDGTRTVSGHSWGTPPWETDPLSRRHQDGVVLARAELDGAHARKQIAHETGHWMGLLHPFANTSVVPGTRNCYGDGDFIDDTPMELAGASMCGQNTCNDPYFVDPIDPTWDFMDYSSDDCKYRFTYGQIVRMNDVFYAYRVKPADDLILVGGTNLTTVPLAGANSPLVKLNVMNPSVSSFPAFATVSPVGGRLLGDFDGDGISDVAVTGVAGWTSLPVLFSNNTGTFSVTSGDVGTFGAYSAAATKWLVGDFNGKEACFTTNPQVTCRRSDVALLGGGGWTHIPTATSRGDGSFSVTSSYLPSFQGYARVGGVEAFAGDVNGDGKDDLFLLGGSGWTAIPVALSSGGGVFTEVYGPGGAVSQYAYGVKKLIGDFNADGRIDVVLTGGSGWSNIPVALGTSNGTFRISNAVFATFQGWASAPGVSHLVGDFNGDHKSDIALVAAAGWTSVPVALSNGDGTFQLVSGAQQTFVNEATQANVRRFVVDLNRDGKSDILLLGGSWDYAPALISKGDGTFFYQQWSLTNTSLNTWVRQSGVTVHVGRFVDR